MAEWSIAPVLKTDVLRGTGGSNPSLSAKNKKETKQAVSFFRYKPIWQPYDNITFALAQTCSFGRLLLFLRVRHK